MENGFLSNIFGFLVEVAHAQTQISVGGTSGAGGVVSSPQETIVNIYNFALMIGGILAFGMIVYGAIKHTLSGGNPSGQSEARDIITQALLGLLLLMGAFIVLNLINPELTGLNLPTLGKIEAVREGQLPSPPLPPGRCGSALLGFVMCESLSNVGCKNLASCSAYPGLAIDLLAIEADSGVGITVTESMPPTTAHQSGGHANGCSVDIIVENVDGVSTSKNCDKVEKVLNSARILGFSVKNEYPACPGGSKSQYWTAGHLHLTKNNCP